MSAEPRSPDGIELQVRGREARLSRNGNSTEEPADLPEHLKVNSKGLPEKVFLLRQKLYLKAKREPGYRFYTLYEAVCRPDVLQAAWERVAANGGAPGVDHLSIEAVQKSDHGVSGFISEIERSLKNRMNAHSSLNWVPPKMDCNVQFSAI